MMGVVEREEVFRRKAADACVFEAGELVNLGTLEAEDVSGCNFKNESGFVLYTNEPEDEQAGEEEPPPKPRKKDVAVQNPPVEDVVSTSAPEALLSLATDAGVPSVEALVAAPANLQAVLPKAADTSGMTVLLGLVAVAGGGAAWKFYDNWSKRKHEENMARIERGEQDSHASCKAERAALDAKLAQVAERLEGALKTLDDVAKRLEEVRSSSVSLSSNDLDERLEKLEKAFKVSKKKGKA